ncbi:CapA family protein, partial [Candidatus Microgenomates bacterium]|nr:CapA family protein [Candidatus Microgenomates bacterium]
MKQTLTLMGDVMLGRLVNDVLKDRPPSYPWGSTFEVLKRADGRICNLES